MKYWKLLPFNRKKQLVIVIAFRLFLMFFIVILGLGFLTEVTIEQFMGLGVYTLLILLFVLGCKETIINFKNIIKDLEKNIIEK